ncbi:MAG: hypothetical protein R2867_43370 [Caldilineaceae bacterium]
MIGAISTAFLVSMARLVITIYLSYNRIGTVYGAAGFVIIHSCGSTIRRRSSFSAPEFTVYSRTYGLRRRQPPGSIKLRRRKPPPAIRWSASMAGSAQSKQHRRRQARPAFCGKSG